MTSQAYNLIREKNTSWNRYQKNRSGDNWTIYKNHRNKVTKAIKNAKRAYEKSVANNSRNNLKGFWKYIQQKTKVKTGINDLVVDGKSVVQDQDKAEVLNKFFASVFTVESKGNIPKLNKVQGAGELNDLVITEEKVKKQLKALRTDKSPGPDKIHNKVLLETCDVMTPILTARFKKSFESGELPEAWKHAEVVPIFKKGSKKDPNNYRPVSLTSTCCKIMEKLIRDQISDYMEQYQLLSPSQHGFRSGRSCCTQLLESVHEITDALDNRTPVDIIYLDYKKAFDSVPYERLLVKLGSIGIGGNLLNWIRSFLTDRKQVVVVNGSKSAEEDVTSGIPQGSVLGPLLFLIYINDLPEEVSTNAKLFADDSKLSNIIASQNDAAELQEDLTSLSHWSSKWQLPFNTGKCKVMHIGPDNPKHEYYMDENGNKSKISEVESEKDLGVTFDNQLKFNKHIEMSITKASQRVGLIRRSFKHMDKHMFLTLYKSLVRPVLEYCSTVWCTNTKTMSEKLERVQRRATKIVTQISNLDYPSRLKRLNLPSLVYRRRRADVLQIYRILSGIDHLNSNLIVQLDNSNRTRGHSKKLIKPRVTSTIKQHTLGYRVIQDWNSLPEEVVTAENVNVFKTRLEKFWEDKDFKFDPSGHYGVLN